MGALKNYHGPAVKLFRGTAWRLSANMPITIINPQPAPQRPIAVANAGSDIDSDSDGGADVEGDISMGGTGVRHSGDDGLFDEILTPGTVITDNAQWMR